VNGPLLSPLDIYLRGYRVSSTSDAKLAYNELTYTTLQKYSSLLSRLVAMSMRMLDAFFSAPQTATLLLQGTSKQISASLHLYSAILRQQPTFDYPVILDRLHTFLVSLAKPGELSTDMVACPSDQLLYLLDFRRGHICRRMSAVCSDCAALRFCIKSILFHVARLAHDKISSFQWFQQPDITNAASGIYDSEECDDDNEEDDNEDNDGDGGNNSSEDSERGVRQPGMSAQVVDDVSEDEEDPLAMDERLNKIMNDSNICMWTVWFAIGLVGFNFSSVLSLENDLELDQVTEKDPSNEQSPESLLVR
jgi:hypothetical protein